MAKELDTSDPSRPLIDPDDRAENSKRCDKNVHVQARA